MSKVTIYTSNNCGSCKMVKKFLQIKGADYSELNIDENPSLRQEAISLSGAMTVPVMIRAQLKAFQLVITQAN